MKLLPERPAWKTNPPAEKIVQEALSLALARSPEATAYAQALLDQCAVRLRDIVDHFVLPENFISTAALQAAGWVPDAEEAGVMRNPTGFFPAILRGPKLVLAFKVEQVREFVVALGLDVPIEGKAHAPFRRCCAWTSADVEIHVVQRSGSARHAAHDPSDEQIRVSRLHLQAFLSRRREFDEPGAGFDHTDKLVEAAVADLGAHWACDLFLRAERAYWMQRNAAGRLQKLRQDRLGLGWANQDHHTYDSSRVWFHRNIKVLETLGFECRERFYAGADAGWGSQILEQPVLGSIIFTDIDLAPHELEFDFAHSTLEPLPELRRAGLWTELHGESMLKAGLNHLECMFDQKRLREQFAALGIQMMRPFSDFPHLYQELTLGEWWPVDPRKMDELERAGLITPAQAEDFRLNGAIGSHFENLERNEGYKGFNQPGIDGVLRIIDPRKNLVGAGA